MSAADDKRGHIPSPPWFDDWVAGLDLRWTTGEREAQRDAEVAALRAELVEARKETMRMHRERMLGVRADALRQAAGVCTSPEDRDAVMALVWAVRS